jgi:transposase
VWAKRLEEGRFVSNWAHLSTRQMDWTGLKLLLEGIEPARYKRRFKRPENASKPA